MSVTDTVQRFHSSNSCNDPEKLDLAALHCVIKRSFQCAFIHVCLHQCLQQRRVAFSEISVGRWVYTNVVFMWRTDTLIGEKR